MLCFFCNIAKKKYHYMRFPRFAIIFLFVMFASVVLQAQKDSFPLPVVPSTIKTPEARANYLALHYWDLYEFSDNGLIGNKDVSEQGFSNFISIMPYVTQREAAFEALVARMNTNPKMTPYFVALAEKYLSEPLSPVYNEDLYLLMLEKVVASKGLSELDKGEYKFDLKMAKKNRLGTRAANFTYLCRNGMRGELWDVCGGEYVLLLFGDPDCNVCMDAKEQLAASAIIKDMVDDKRLTVLSVCVEGKTKVWEKSSAPDGWIDACDEKMVIYDKQLYEIKGLPVIYILDSECKVVMKNVQPHQVLRFFSEKK